MSVEHSLPTIEMEPDTLVSEGTHAAVLHDVTFENGLLRFCFRITQRDMDNPFVNGICEPVLKESSQLMRWLRAFGGLEYEEGRKIDLNEYIPEIMGAHCFVVVKHRTKDDRTFVNVNAVFAHNDPRFATKGEA